MGTLILLIIIAVIIYCVVGASPSRSRAVDSHPSGRKSQTSRSFEPNRRSRTEGPPPSIAEAIRESAGCWLPPGEDARVAGYDLHGGMLYLGGRMRALRGWGASDPALLDMSLRVNRGRPDHAGQFMRYWPSYSDIPPTSRAAYLEWLSEGRRDPAAYIGYVFLFFYGIERRALLDAQHLAEAKSEVPQLLAEVERLLTLYGGNNSFRGYASGFLEIMQLIGHPMDSKTLEPPRDRSGFEYPLRLRLALGAMSKEGEPIPPDWALAWLRCSPEVSLRTPAHRCADEFDELFLLRYREKYGEGMKVKPNKTRLAAAYRPASATFGGEIELAIPDLPDVTRLQGPTNRLSELGDGVCGELDGYSRWVGRNEDRTSPAALALLPAELVSDRMGEEARALIDPVAEEVRQKGVAILKTADLVERFPSKQDEKLTKKEACLLGDFLGSLGFGIEPDARYGGPNLSRSDVAAIFRLPDGDSKPSDAYRSAAVLLHLGTAVAAADDAVTVEEEQRLEVHLEDVLNLSDPDRARLKAHLGWLLASPPSLNGLKRRIEELPEELRHAIGGFLITVAGADGQVSAEELKVLAKIYPLLGLDQEAVYRDVHAMAASTPAADVGPVPVLPADASEEFAIPATPQARSDTVALDMDKVAAVREQSRKAAAVLESIFSGDEEAPDEVSSQPVEEDVAEDVVLLHGLDGTHSALLLTLAQRRHWSRSELDALADRHGVLASGAVEIINDASFEVCGEPFLEGLDPIDVNPYALEEMLT